MKAIVSTILISSILVMSSTAVKVDKEFLLGFETGLMQRTNDNVFEEFNCEVAEGKNEIIAKLSAAVDKFRMFSQIAVGKAGKSMPENNVLMKFFDSIELFIDSVGDMSAAFIDYPGTDYCAGLNFGYNGAYFLTRFVTTVNALKDLQDANQLGQSTDSSEDSDDTDPERKERNTGKDGFAKQRQKLKNKIARRS